MLGRKKLLFAKFYKYVGLIKHRRQNVKMFNKIKNGTEADFRLKGATF
jgi:hypothetical protein